MRWYGRIGTMTGATGRATATRTLSEADFAVPSSDRYFGSWKSAAIFSWPGRPGWR